MKTKILIVEDEALIALDLRHKLELAGYSVPVIADNAADALLSAERDMPGLVLMDIRLHGPKDGIETAEEIRRRFHLPVMFVTAHADSETLARARITEPFGYIVKPFHGVDFRAQIEMALWKHVMEQRLRISEAWLSTTFRNVADALIATDSEGNIAFMNEPAAELTGWNWRDARGQPLLEVFQAFDEATDLPVVHPLDAIFDGREISAGSRTFKLRRRDGAGSRIVEAELSANRDEESVLGVIAVFRDISERRKAESVQRQLQKMNALALMAVGLGRELAESQKRMDSLLQDLLSRTRGYSLRIIEGLYECSGRVQSVVHQLSGMGKADAGKAAPIDLNEVLTGMEEQFTKLLRGRRGVNLNLQASISPIMADADELRAHLLRLVTDSRAAMPDGGVVEVSTAEAVSADNTPCVYLTIKDTGRPIRSMVKDRVFDPFYQSRAGGGNPGFSLALLYRFVAMSGGNIEIESEPGEGVTYLLSFPADKLNSPPLSGSQSVAASAR